LEFTRSIWRFPPESAKKVGHPAPFPEELPYRCIQLYTFKEDVVLDPFVGSGTTCVAALKAGRHCIGIDIDERYVEIAKKRLEELLKTRSSSS
ncbi:MAG: site-specific DNA-methyltransferase, partial [Sulfolobales archaeon]